MSTVPSSATAWPERPAAILRHLAGAGVAVVGLAVAAAAAPVLTSADARITFSAATACEVALTLTVTGATDIEHRLEILDGSRTELLEVRGAAQAGAVREIGRTLALVVKPSGESYTLRYRVTQPDHRPHRCPIWLPAAPADGLTRNVRLRVAVPPGTSASGTMPSLAWTGAGPDDAASPAPTGPVGVATLGHLPAFVVVPFAAAGRPRPWDVSRVMDAAAIGTLVLASAVWLRRRKGPS